MIVTKLFMTYVNRDVLLSNISTKMNTIVLDCSEIMDPH